MNELPDYDLYWLGEPSRYTDKDKLLKSFPEGDLGGRYIALPISRSPAALFDDTFPYLKALAKRAHDQALMAGRPSSEVALINGIQMTWVFASAEIQRLGAQNEALEARIKKLESLLASSEQPS